MPSIRFDDEREPSSRDELLARVRGEGLRRRYRRRGLVGGVALALVMAIAVPVLARDGGDSPGRVAAVDQPTTTVEEETTTTEVVLDAGPSTTEVSPSTTPKVPRTTTSLVCRNSFDERCGEFRWDPDPGPNQAATVTITFTPANPVVGERVTAHISVADPDGPPGSCSGMIEWGDGPGQAWDCDAIHCESWQVPHGPWSPPPREAGRYEFDGTHTFDAAGAYTVTFSGSRPVNGTCDRPASPYGNEKSGSATLTVSPAPA